MIGEVDVAGIFISPLLLCLLVGFATRIVLSRLLEWVGFYRYIWRRPLFDTALFLILTGAAFAALRLLTR
ncbi:hypothetical protein FHS51_003812 [Sphingobium wenxiniae]|uniref:DUF1656 domain-containing protein n=1 Tax=Sphingobium wenxiniae (strain DSM 21828 / CGMCC 1.7748 / JZ-1) TaxID=595605 RepID=UPI0008760734|nr:DUF1656 domain-containing protein [Sphingobium wenxiniae]MBB6193554.1 hypothetical protein [Sphingobium wenxiniae]SCW94119.1 Protein of unknown function [Sphingobium faniae]